MVFEGFTNALKDGGRIEIRRFGNFTVREYGACTGRNPKTGTNIKVGSKRGIFFKVGQELKERVNQGSK